MSEEIYQNGDFVIKVGNRLNLDNEIRCYHVINTVHNVVEFETSVLIEAMMVADKFVADLEKYKNDTIIEKHTIVRASEPQENNKEIELVK